MPLSVLEPWTLSPAAWSYLMDGSYARLPMLTWVLNGESKAGFGSLFPFSKTNQELSNSDIS